MDVVWCDEEPATASTGPLAHLVLDAESSVNALNESVMAEFRQELAKLSSLDGVKALVLWSAKEKHFVAGADIDQIADIRYAETGVAKAAEGQASFQQLADLPFPTFVVIRGTCLGGGLELALAARYRIAVDDESTRIGLPEVNLGIIPGFGGTQRLPRLVGLRRALAVILGGKRLPAAAALRQGLVDGVVPTEGYRNAALQSIRQILADGGASVRRRRQKVRGPTWQRILFDGNPIGRRLVRARASKGIERATGGHYPAPKYALRAVIEGLALPLERGLELEAKLCGELIATPISKNLIKVFKDSERARQRAFADGAEWPEEGVVAVLGAGVMGAGVAGLLLQRGQSVRLRDLSADALTKGLSQIGALLNKAVKSRRSTARERDAMLSRLTHTTELRGFGSVQMVIEAIVERLDVKQNALREIEPLLADGAVFATNTSALSITAIQSAAKQPDRVVGLHFFNPVHRMPLVEVIPGKQTSDDAVSLAVSLAQRLGKFPVVVKDRPGFLVNRVLAPYLNSACALLERGVAGPDIDRAAVQFGLPMGPFRLLDEVGLDIAREVSETLHHAFGARAAPATLLQGLIDQKLLGRKTGAGFYRYSSDPKQPPEWNTAVPGARSGTEPFSVDSTQVVSYLIDRMVDEAARCLEEEVVECPSDVDLAMIMGTGFPPFSGGPLRFADASGLAAIVDRLRDRAERGEKHVVPCDLLVRLSRDGKTFYSLEPLRNPQVVRAV